MVEIQQSRCDEMGMGDKTMYEVRVHSLAKSLGMVPHVHF